MKSSRSVARGIGGIALSLLLLLGCRSDPSPDSDDPITPRAVNETGYLVADSIHYTAEEPLGARARLVTVLGAPGAVRRVGGELSVNGGAPITVTNPDGAFVLITNARLDDELELRYVLDGRTSRLTVNLDQRLRSFRLQFAPDGGADDDAGPVTEPEDGGVAADQGDGGRPDAGRDGSVSDADPDAGSTAGRVDWLTPGAEPGQVRVHGLDEPPYLVYNADRGLIVRVDDPGTIEIAADDGEMICVAQLDEDSGAVTTSDCSAAP